MENHYIKRSETVSNRARQLFSSKCAGNSEHELSKNDEIAKRKPYMTNTREVFPYNLSSKQDYRML